MKQDTLADIEAAKRRFELAGLIALAVFAAIIGLLNFYVGIYWRALIALAAMLVALAILYQRTRQPPGRVPTWLVVAVVTLPLISAIVTNGGFTDARGAISFPLLVVGALLILGITQIRLVFRVALMLFIPLVALELGGFLGQFKVSEAGPIAINVILLMNLSFLVGIYIVSEISNRQTQLLTESVALADSYAEELRVSLTEAEQARAAESLFLANMSHELRNPLNGVVGLIENALVKNDLREVRTNLSSALIATSHLTSVVDDILTLKKVEADTSGVALRPCDIFELCSDWIKLFDYSAKQASIKLIMMPPDATVPRVLMLDSQLVSKAVINLISNALKFTEAGGEVQLTLRYAPDLEALTLIVSDTGIGMDYQTQQRIFGRFTQGHSGQTKSHQGVGLGLAIVEEIVSRLDGTIALDSAPEAGSTFTLMIPAAIAANRADGEEQAAVKTAIKNVPETSLSNIRALCVDDSRVNLEVLCQYLENAGASADRVESARQAIEQCAANHYDIVLTDISMPEMDGEALQQELAHLYPGLPVIAVSGNVLSSDVERYRAGGFSGVLSKPVCRDQLLKEILRHVSTGS